MTTKFLAAQTFMAVGNSPAEFTAFMKADRENTGRLLKSLGVKPLDTPEQAGYSPPNADCTRSLAAQPVPKQQHSGGRPCYASTGHA